MRGRASTTPTARATSPRTWTTRRSRPASTSPRRWLDGWPADAVEVRLALLDASRNALREVRPVERLEHQADGLAVPGGQVALEIRIHLLLHDGHAGRGGPGRKLTRVAERPV